MSAASAKRPLDVARIEYARKRRRAKYQEELLRVDGAARVARLLHELGDVVDYDGSLLSAMRDEDYETLLRWDALESFRLAMIAGAAHGGDSVARAISLLVQFIDEEAKRANSGDDDDDEGSESDGERATDHADVMCALLRTCEATPALVSSATEMFQQAERVNRRRNGYRWAAQKDFENAYDQFIGEVGDYNTRLREACVEIYTNLESKQ